MTKGPFGIINDLIGVADTVGQFIAGPDRDGLAGHIQQGYRTRCNQAANVPPWLINLSISSRTLLNSFCGPYYDSQGVDGFEASPPAVQGGQCPGVTYQVTLVGTNNTNGASFSSNQGNKVGPISKVAYSLTPPVCSAPSILFAWEFRDGNGNLIARSAGCGPIAGTISAVCTPLNPADDEDCGDQPDPDNPLRPGPNPPPDPGPLPGPEPTDGPDGSPFPELPIPPFPGPFGDVPVEAPPEEPVAVDPTTIPPTGGDGLPGLPDAIGAPAGEVEGGEDGEEIEFGAPPEGRVWVGCSIQATVDARLGNIPGTGPQSTVYAFVIGNAALRYGSFYGTSKRINSRFTLLGRETTAVIVDGCFVQGQPGVTLVVRPISAETCPESPCST